MGKCNHSNPPYHAYCVVCGEKLPSKRCSCCGAVCNKSFSYCSQCGYALDDQSNNSQPSYAASKNAHTYDLDALILTASKSKLSTIKLKDRATQDDIKAMLKLRKKGKKA